MVGKAKSQSLGQTPGCQTSQPRETLELQASRVVESQRCAALFPLLLADNLVD